MNHLLDALRHDGVAVTTADDLLGPALWHELQAGVKQLRTQPIADAPLTDASQAKTYLTRYLGSSPIFDASTLWARIAMEAPIHALAEAYVPHAQLAHYNVWRTQVCTDPPKGSQLWHRDAEDRIMLKAFVYLTDVDQDSGPLWYLPGTQRGGRRRKLQPPFLLQQGIPRVSDKAMAKCVPQSEWRELTGLAGTVILADTAGYHKGGHALTHERWLYTCQFTTPHAVPRAGRPFLS